MKKDSRSTQIPLRKTRAKRIACLLLLLVTMVSIFTIVLVFRNHSGFISYAGVLYNVAGKTFFTDVYVLYPDGNIKKISPSNNGIYYQAHINSKGDKVVFYGNDIGPPRIWLANIETGNVAALTPDTSGARHPVFSWDGSMIAFASDRSYKQNSEKIELMHGNGLPPEDLVLNLFIMDTEGRNVRQITFGPYQDQRPAFSPDGNTLVFVSNRGGADKWRLWTVKINENSPPKPIPMDVWGYRPWFSPDAKWIYFFTEIKGRHQICKVSKDGGEVYPLHNDDKGNSHGPFVDYNNKTLLIHSTRSEQFGLWELPIDGSAPRALSPLGFHVSMHATRSKNGVIAFDTERRKVVRIVASHLKKWLPD